MDLILYWSLRSFHTTIWIMHFILWIFFFFNTSGSILFLQSDVLIIRSMSFPSQILSGSVTHSSFGPMYDMVICASFINVSFFINLYLENEKPVCLSVLSLQSDANLLSRMFFFFFLPFSSLIQTYIHTSMKRGKEKNTSQSSFVTGNLKNGN